MQTGILISKIIGAQHLAELMALENYKTTYRAIAKILHPDVCKLKGSTEAMAKLSLLKEQYEKGQLILDEAGEIKANGTTFTFSGEANLLKKSYDQYQLLKLHKDKTALAFHRYLPKQMQFTKAGIQVHLADRAVPLSGLQLPLPHVLWILSRMLEVTSWFSQIGYVHMGIHPESVWVVPETHGIIMGSFYHMKPTGERLQTIASKYQHWYPKEVFDYKEAHPMFDIELCKRTAVYLLGDRSGMGIKLKKTVPPAVIDFLLDTHTDAFNCYHEYRSMLKKNFETKFHQLNI